MDGRAYSYRTMREDPKRIIIENAAYLFRLSCYVHRNPVRAGIVERLSGDKSSSYQYYAYRRTAPAWHKTGPIFEQVRGEDKNKAYRRIEVIECEKYK